MQRPLFFKVITPFMLVGFLLGCQAPSVPFMSRCPSLSDVVDSPARTPELAARDRYRHPAETLEFFQVKPDQTVVEIWPGRGWYSEILAPYLHRCGTFYAAGFDAEDKDQSMYRTRIQLAYLDKLKAEPDLYSRAIVTVLNPPANTAIAPPSRADRVLTFRNVHNWMKADYAEDVFAAMYDALKPGGILGVVEHRAAPGTDFASMTQSGYVTEAYVIALAEQAGFKLDARSEINANPKDTKDHPAGVWSLPPSLRDGKATMSTYLDIGESDRMTLRFIKEK